MCSSSTSQLMTDPQQNRGVDCAQLMTDLTIWTEWEFEHLDFIEVCFLDFKKVLCVDFLVATELENRDLGEVQNCARKNSTFCTVNMFRSETQEENKENIHCVEYVERYTPPKLNIDPKNDGLENVSPFKYGYCGIYLKFQGWTPLLYLISF